MTAPVKFRLLPAVLFLLVSSTSPAVVHAAVARATAVAEVVDPAVIDSAKLLATAGGSASQQREKTSAAGSSQVQPQVQLTVVDGVPFLSIDYN